MKRINPIFLLLAMFLLGIRPAAQAQSCLPPTGVRAVSTGAPGNNTAVVSFSPSPSAQSYTVRYYWVGDSTAAGQMSMTATGSPITLTGLRTGLNAYYRVAVVSNCAGGATSSSPWITFLVGASGGPGPGTCAPPTNVVAATTATTATVSFAPISGVSSYQLVYYAQGDSAHAVTLPVAGSPVVISGLAPYTLYTARLSSNCSGTASGPTGFAFRTLALPTPCGAVTNLTVTGASATTATVSFTPGVGNISYYISYHLLNDSTRRVYTNSSSATLPGLVAGNTYYIQVVSLCGSGVSTVYTASGQVGFTFRGALAVRNGLEDSSVGVYPNPAHQKASVVLPAVSGAPQVQLQLLNILSQPVLTQTVRLATLNETRAQLDLTGINPGLYTLRVLLGGQWTSQRLAVE